MMAGTLRFARPALLGPAAKRRKPMAVKALSGCCITSQPLEATAAHSHFSAN
jgi:hypothetical protein